MAEEQTTEEQTICQTYLAATPTEVFNEILSYLVPYRESLQAISLTDMALRERTLPILFSRVKISISVLTPFPTHLLDHVRHLSIYPQDGAHAGRRDLEKMNISFSKLILTLTGDTNLNSIAIFCTLSEKNFNTLFDGYQQYSRVEIHQDGLANLGYLAVKRMLNSRAIADLKHLTLADKPLRSLIRQADLCESIARIIRYNRKNIRSLNLTDLRIADRQNAIADELTRYSNIETLIVDKSSLATSLTLSKILAGNLGLRKISFEHITQFAELPHHRHTLEFRRVIENVGPNGLIDLTLGSCEIDIPDWIFRANRFGHVQVLTLRADHVDLNAIKYMEAIVELNIRTKNLGGLGTRTKFFNLAVLTLYETVLDVYVFYALVNMAPALQEVNLVEAVVMCLMETENVSARFNRSQLDAFSYYASIRSGERTSLSDAITQIKRNPAEAALSRPSE